MKDFSFSPSFRVSSADAARWVISLCELLQFVGNRGERDRSHFDDAGNPRTELARVHVHHWGKYTRSRRAVPIAYGPTVHGEYTIVFKAGLFDDPLDVGIVVQAYFERFRPNTYNTFELVWTDEHTGAIHGVSVFGATRKTFRIPVRDQILTFENLPVDAAVVA